VIALQLFQMVWKGWPRFWLPRRVCPRFPSEFFRNLILKNPVVGLPLEANLKEERGTSLRTIVN
jgi:hypothetical protein